MSGAAHLQTLLEALQRRARFGMVLGLDRMRAALSEVGDPHAGLACVHVAGSNGKGSTCAMIEAILREAGLRTGLYTSPHLSRFAERIQIGGEPIGDAAFARALAPALAAGASHGDKGKGSMGPGEQASPGLAELTFFETLTIAAFLAFRDAGVDVAVLEVGLGGRLDATNVIEAPLATAITSIALEHTEVLGGTLDRIAREKAGILKRGSPVVLGPLDPEADRAIQEVAAEAGAGPIWRVIGGSLEDARGAIAVSTRADGRVTITPPGGREAGRAHASRAVAVSTDLGLRGPHQAENAAIAAGVAWILADRWPSIAPEVAAGLSKARWPGRFERIDKGGVHIILDCAHNPHGAAALARTLAAEGVQSSRTRLVFGALADKSWREMLAEIAPLSCARYYTSPKGRSPAPLDELRAIAPGEAIDSPRLAIERAMADAHPGDTVLVTGSIYLVGEARASLLGIEADPIIAL